jgi:hypothetical protein
MDAKVAQIVITLLLGITPVFVLWGKPEMEQRKEGAKYLNYLMEMHIQFYLLSLVRSKTHLILFFVYYLFQI